MTGRLRPTRETGETAGTGVERGGETGGAGPAPGPGPGPGPGVIGGGAGVVVGAEIGKIIGRGGAGRETGVPGGRDTGQSPRPVKMTGRTVLLTTPS